MPATSAPSQGAPGGVASAYALIPLLSVALIVTVEAVLIAQGRVLAGQLVYAALLLMLLNAAAMLRGESPEARAGRAAMQALAIVPLIRVVGAGLPLRDLSSTTGQLLVAVPVGAAALLLAPVVGVPRKMFVAARHAPTQMVAIGCGLGLGLVAYLLGAPALWPAGAAGDRIPAAIAAAILGAAVQEMVFRGVVQVSLERVLGRAGLVATSLLFAAMYFDAGSMTLVMTSALAGLIFAHTVARTATLGGVIAGHVLFAVGSGGLWPALLGRDDHGLSDDPIVAVLLATALLGITVLALLRPAARPVPQDEERLALPDLVPAPLPVRRDRPREPAEGVKRPAAVNLLSRTDRRTQSVVLASLLIMLMGIGGFFVGRAGNPNEGSPIRVTQGPLSMTLPRGWERRPAANALPGVTVEGAVAGGPRVTPQAGIVAWRVRRKQETLLPLGLISLFTEPREVVRLSRYDAYRRENVRLGNGQLTATAYSIPTAEGAVLVACYSPPPIAQRFLAECQKAASTVDLDGLQAVERGTLAGEQRRLNAVMAELARRRAAGRRRLFGARAPTSQAAAARYIQLAYRAARRSLARARFGPASHPRQARLVAALADLETGYRDLGRAARQRSHGRYDSTRRLISRSEGVLRRLARQPTAPG